MTDIQSKNMSSQPASKVELMSDNIIGVFLTEECLSRSVKVTKETSLRLRRFVHHDEPISNVRFLGAGEHGVVVRAAIKGETYALKVFKYWQQRGPAYFRGKDAILISPFARESRAFSRLISINQNGTWAAKCYGWMKLSDTQFERIKAVIDEPSLSQWVIVKEYIPTPTNSSHVPAIYRQFSIARTARILPEDVRVENYRGSKIVDLSSVLTFPCPRSLWSEWEFNIFYEDGIAGVHHWFESPQEEPSEIKSQLLLASTFACSLALMFGVAWFLGRSRLQRRL